jgi:quercetin dioxygenase-like cupin family protein
VSDAFLARHEDGETITARERREAVLLTAQDQITVTSYRLGPGERGPGPHVHHEHADAFYVLEGELDFVLGPSARGSGSAPGGS